MKFLLVLAGLLAASSALLSPMPKFRVDPSLLQEVPSQQGQDSDSHGGGNRIVGGGPAKHGQFPWQIGMYMDNSYFCGGSIISNQWILTAGHCVDDRSTFLVMMGAQYIGRSDEEGRINMATRSAILHEGYNPETVKNDIALIKLPKPVEFSTYIKTVKLAAPQPDTTSYAGLKAVASGWGSTYDEGNISPVLKYVENAILPNSDCAKFFGSLILPTHVCMSGAGRRSACTGDSGGPLMITSESGDLAQIGLTSFGSNTCEGGNPAVYTRVSSYLDWIAANSGVRTAPVY